MQGNIKPEAERLLQTSGTAFPCAESFGISGIQFYLVIQKSGGKYFDFIKP